MTDVRKFHVSETDTGMRLDKFLVSQMPEFSRSEIQRFSVVVNGAPCKFSGRLRVGDVVSVEILSRPSDVASDNISSDFDLDILGFSEEELKELDAFGEPAPESQTEEDEIPEVPTEAITKPGDIWILGNHRLLCGDTTLIDDVQKLMQNDIADMIFTDPPYNVNYGSTMKDSIRYHAGSLGGRKIMNDNLGDGFAQFLTDALSNLMMYCQGAAYVCMSSSELHTLYNSFINAGGKWSLPSTRRASNCHFIFLEYKPPLSLA